MKIRGDWSWAAGLVLTSMVTVPALATESGMYLGVSVGESTFDIDSGDIEAFLVQPDNVQIDDSDTSFSLAFGYRFTPYVGVEVSYTDFGETTAVDCDSNAFISYCVNLSGKLTGLGAAVIGTVPIGNFELNGKLGFVRADAKARASVQASGAVTVNQSESDSQTSTETMYGLGAGYTINDHFHIRLDWARVKAEFSIVEDEEPLEVDVERLSVGFQYRF